MSVNRPTRISRDGHTVSGNIQLGVIRNHPGIHRHDAPLGPQTDGSRSGSATAPGIRCCFAVNHFFIFHISVRRQDRLGHTLPYDFIDRFRQTLAVQFDLLLVTGTGDVFVNNQVLAFHAFFFHFFIAKGQFRIIDELGTERHLHLFPRKERLPGQHMDDHPVSNRCFRWRIDRAAFHVDVRLFQYICNRSLMGHKLFFHAKMVQADRLLFGDVLRLGGRGFIFSIDFFFCGYACSFFRLYCILRCRFRRFRFIVFNHFYIRNDPVTGHNFHILSLGPVIVIRIRLQLLFRRFHLTGIQIHLLLGHHIFLRSL